MRQPRVVILAAVLLVGAWSATASAVERFPPPDFSTDYQRPSPHDPHPDPAAMGYVDIAVLTAALGLASYLAIRRRSRTGVAALSVFSVAYFGFFRAGCVCSIGAIQNVSLAAADPGYAIPLVVLAFFLLPLVFTLFFGRGFCAGVCPLGAIQDVVLLRPVRVPGWLEQALGVVPYIYLGAAVLFAATGTAFLICELDPFIGFFRLSAEWWMLAFGAALLIIGVFVGRPYCRFLCPYGAVLRHLSRLSRWHLSITPGECNQCRLCAESCPFGAIEPPSGETERPTPAGRRRFAALLVALPVLIALTGWLGGVLGPRLAAFHPVVANATASADAADPAATADEATLAQAQAVRDRFTLGGWLLGGFVGLVIGVRIVRLSLHRRHDDYRPDRASCVSCARCLPTCPKGAPITAAAPLVPLRVSGQPVAREAT